MLLPTVLSLLAFASSACLAQSTSVAASPISGKSAHASLGPNNIVVRHLPRSLTESHSDGAIFRRDHAAPAFAPTRQQKRAPASKLKAVNHQNAVYAAVLHSLGSLRTSIRGEIAQIESLASTLTTANLDQSTLPILTDLQTIYNDLTLAKDDIAGLPLIPAPSGSPSNGCPASGCPDAEAIARVLLGIITDIELALVKLTRLFNRFVILHGVLGGTITSVDLALSEVTFGVELVAEGVISALRVLLRDVDGSFGNVGLGAVAALIA